jgi:hypothetical protein
MKPTLESMRLAVAKMLPHEITWEDFNKYFYWQDTGAPVSDREWLTVCWLAEQTLTGNEFQDYWKILNQVTPGVGKAALNQQAFRCAWQSDVRYRLEALCHIRCPEMFTETAL